MSRPINALFVSKGKMNFREPVMIFKIRTFELIESVYDWLQASLNAKIFQIEHSR